MEEGTHTVYLTLCWPCNSTAPSVKNGRCLPPTNCTGTQQNTYVVAYPLVQIILWTLITLNFQALYRHNNLNLFCPLIPNNPVCMAWGLCTAVSKTSYGKLPMASTWGPQGWNLASHCRLSLGEGQTGKVLSSSAPTEQSGRRALEPCGRH